jgi:cysteinyl-tRNA synthetase
MAQEKMSKSVGNVALAHDLLQTHPGEAIRWALLAGHYRQPLEWTGELIDQAKSALDRLYGVLDDSARFLAGAPAPPDAHEPAPARRAYDEVLAALQDDLNTPAAFAALFQLADLVRAAVRARDAAASEGGRELLVEAANLMGFLAAEPQAWFQGAASDDLAAKVDQLIAERHAARIAKNWPEADRIRAELSALNVEVMDGPTGATWRIKE